MSVEKMKLVVLDCDTGIDDAWGLFLLLHAHLKQIKLLGITCVDGNTSVDNVVKNTLYVLATAGKNDVPVFRGSSHPLICPDNDIDNQDLRYFHGRNGFGDTDLPKIPLAEVNKENAVVALNRIVSENQGQVSLLCFGPLTNVALATRTYPDFMKNVKEIYIMGGNYTAQGNTTRTAEFNFHRDPEAANIVITSGEEKVMLLPWETCYSTSIPYEWRMGALGSGQGKVIQLMNLIERQQIERAKRCGLHKWTACDQRLAALFLDNRVAIGVSSLHATVELSGVYTRGQIVVDHLNTNRHNIRVVKKMDEEKFKEMLLQLKDWV